MTDEERDYLCKYVEVRFGEFEKRTNIRFEETDKRMAVMTEAEQRALHLSSQIMEKRLESMNEFRAAMADQANNFVKRDEFLIHVETLRRDMDLFSRFKEERSNVPTDIENIKRDVKSLTTFKDNMDGKANQSSVLVALAFSLIAAVFGAISLVLRLLEK